MTANSTDSPTRTALVIGTGRMARLRVLGLRAAGMDVVITGRDAARAEQTATELEVPAVPYAEAAQSRYACAVVSSASEDHREHLQMFLPVAPITLCEKPVAVDVADARELLTTIEELGHELYVGFQRRFDPHIAAVRQRCLNGSLGTLLHLRASDFDRRPGVRAFIAKSGGMFKDLVIHDLDWVLWTTRATISSVHATGSVLINRDYADLDDCDTSTVSVVLSNGALATINASRAHPGGQDVRMEVLGTLGAVSVGLTPATPLEALEGLGDLGSAPAPQDFMQRFATAFEAETDQFARYVLGQTSSFGGCTLDEAVTALVAAKACETSWRTGRVVTLDEQR